MWTPPAPGWLVRLGRRMRRESSYFDARVAYLLMLWPGLVLAIVLPEPAASICMYFFIVMPLAVILWVLWASHEPDVRRDG